MPDTGPLKLNGPAVALLQTEVLDGTLTDGVGLTVRVNVCTPPVQLLAPGVTLNTAVATVVPVLIAVKEDILPVPLPARPMLVLLLVQL